MSLPLAQDALALAIQHHQAGHLREAEPLYQQVLTDNPNHAQALHNLGALAHQTGRNDLAADLLRRATTVMPNWPEAQSNLANVLTINGQWDEAIIACQRSIALKPDYPEAYNNLGNALHGKGDFEQSIAACRRAIALKPTFAEAWNTLGTALKSKGELDEAIAAHRQAILYKPTLAEAHNNLGNALQQQEKLSEAAAAYRQAIALRPNYAKALCNLGNTLRDIGQFPQAVAYFRQAIALQPNLPEAHGNFATVLLAQGDYAQGWKEYEWRWQCKDFSAQAQILSHPQWDGSSLNGRTILLHTEQGYGDAIQFARYIPLVAQHEGKIIIQCQAKLQRLFRSLAPPCEIISRGQPLPFFDVHCPLMSSPLVFQTSVNTIPHRVPYLHPEPDLIEQWKQKLPPPDGKLRIALAWAGSPGFTADRTRSLHLKQLAPFANITGATFFSIQKGAPAEQIKNPPPGLNPIDLGPDLHDFADTAAVMSLMDLVITTDTSIPHLAGALNYPVWIMLKSIPDWRWLLHRDDSPWYPSMRLFRQSTAGDWSSVINRVAEELTRRSEIRKKPDSV